MNGGYPSRRSSFSRSRSTSLHTWIGLARLMSLGESFLGEAIVMRVTKLIMLGVAATFILGTGIISAAAANGTQGAHGAAVSAAAKTQSPAVGLPAKTTGPPAPSTLRAAVKLAG